MTAAVKGKSREEATALFDRFHGLVTGTLPASEQSSLGSLRAFGGVARFPLRVKCASLAWHALRSALESAAPAMVTTDGDDAAKTSTGEGA
jgi:nitrogen fixation NifU-like protein